MKYAFSETSSDKGTKRRETEYQGILRYLEVIRCGSCKDKRKLVKIIVFL
jgi:hypothetical protein